VFLPQDSPFLGAVFWGIALGAAAGPLLAVMAECWLHGGVTGGWLSALPRWLWGSLVTLLHLSLLVLPTAWLAAAAGASVPASVLLLGALLFTAPFHALLAPALTLAAAEGAGFHALRLTGRAAGARTWLHLGLMIALGVVLGAILGTLSRGVTEWSRGMGDAVLRVLELGAVSLAGSVWAAAVVVCGLDTLAARPATSPEDASPPE
jgi:hypothetical protein